uniref:Ion transport domain-containing protein n=1 Tax=Gouania willdenowi TaxID=441366 RepID=A0A8C5GQZ7_GOUWI
MKKSEMFGFTLEADDRSVEDKARQKASKKDGVVSALGLGEQEPKAPMDTDYQEEMEETKPMLRFNLNFDKGIRGEQQSHDDRRDSKTFNIEQLFEAVASRDVRKLDGLYEYLHRNMKRLSDSLYQSYGKTALMKALLHLKDGKNETVELLINISERLGDIKEFVNAVFTSSYYKGQTALHIAIERRSMSYVELLVSKGADVHAKACGRFFQPHDGPNFYFGELPLSLAACTNQPDMVEFLMANEYMPTDAKMTDSHGNTVLHALVVVADNSTENTEFIINMYDLILKINARLHPKVNLEDIQNKNGLTPLKMAAKNGKIGIFSHILQREFQESNNKHLSRKFTEWVYGPVHCALYDMDSLDSSGGNSVLDILVYGSEIPVSPSTVTLYPHRMLVESCDSINIPHHCLNLQIIDMKRKRPKLKTLLIDGYYEILFFVQGLLFLISTGLYLCGRQEYLGFLVVCLALSWVNLLYFSRGDQHMGVYSVMIQRMILSDILRFLFVYIVFLFGFSAAVVTLLIEPPKQTRLFAPVGPGEECLKPSFRNISYTTLQLFKFTIGMGDMEFTQDYQYKEVFYMLLIGYIVLTYILLLNMLIALMNRTVEKITMESASIWKLQRAVTILDMERRLPCCLRKGLRSGVEIKLRTALGDDLRRCFRLLKHSLVTALNQFNSFYTILINVSAPELFLRMFSSGFLLGFTEDD